jgi:hypothetical protein
MLKFVPMSDSDFVAYQSLVLIVYASNLLKADKWSFDTST